MIPLVITDTLDKYRNLLNNFITKTNAIQKKNYIKSCKSLKTVSTNKLHNKFFK